MTAVRLPGVGANLTDHPLSALVLLPKKPGWTSVDPSGSNLLEAGLFFSREVPEPGFDADVQFHFSPHAPIFVAARGTPTAMAIAINPCRPVSRGTIRLRSTEPFDTPLIDPAYLSDPDDIRLQIEALREARRIAASEPLATMVERELLPGPSCKSDAELELFMRAASDCAWHPVGTCRMGVREDAVVDPELRVHGLRSLRVADASVMPRITSANTNAPTIMIAEKAAKSLM